MSLGRFQAATSTPFGRPTSLAIICPISPVSFRARNSVLETLEPIFHQDLNGDGSVGPVKASIETKGVTHLTHVGDNYDLDNALGSGPTLQRDGIAVVSGQFGAWTPIGAERLKWL